LNFISNLIKRPPYKRLNQTLDLLNKNKLNRTLTRLFFFLIFLTFTISVKAQYCDPGVPVLIADLTGNPDSAWLSPAIVRDEHCCGATNPDKCIEFILTLDPAATAINFDVCVGAKPPGALFYQIDCGPMTPVGDPICLSTPGPHHLTFCKPGNNDNQYCITSIGAPTITPPQIINDGCTGVMSVTNYDPATITWTSISPGAPGAYNSYLSCTSGCSTVNVAAQPGFPPFVDFQACGIPEGACSPAPVCLITRVNFNPTLGVTIAPLNPTICFGQAGTTITANPTGGTPPYNYIWSTGETTQSIFVGVGTYAVVIGDASGCPPVTTNVTVTAFAATITANAGADINTCNLNPTVTLNGSVTGTTTGIWSGGLGTFTPGNTTLNATYTPTPAELASGSVTLTLTTTGNGTCPAGTDQVTINYLPFQGTLSTSATDVSCNGGNNGTVTVLVTGTATPYTYSWTTAPVQTTATATGLPVGTYTVTVSDNLGCPLTASATVNQPPPLTTSMTHTDVSCFFGNNGTATVTAFGGNGGYTYSWNTAPVQTTATATGLTAGSYTVTVTDLLNCQTTATVTITQPSIIVAIISKTDVTCNGSSNGEATVNTVGGAGGYTYVWNPSLSTAQTATGLSAGGYTVTVTDANGCIATANTTIGQPTNPLTVTSSQVNVSCFGGNNGSATVVPAGGTPGYTYSWSTAPVQTGATATGLTAGNYTVTVTDANGCFVTQAFTITQPPVLNVTTGTIVTVSCFGGTNGTANVFVSGGTAGYTYSWSTTPVQTTPTATNLSPGTYTVTVTDANGCSAQNTAIIVTQPGAALTATVISQTNVSCYGANDGSVTVSAAGGTAPYTYSWAPSGGTAATANNLAAGSYTLTVTDSRGCINTVMANITQPPQITFALTKSDATCNTANGQATAVASGGVPGYAYTWTPFGGNASATPATLSAQSYTVTVTDATGCVADTFVLINNLSSPTADTTGITPVTCFGGNDGSVSIDTSGGVPPLTISWNTAPVQTGTTATGLTSGNYIATVTDASGCIVQVAAFVPEPTRVTLTTSQTIVSCFGGNDGTAVVTAFGGSPGYTYSWSTAPMQVNDTAVGLSAGPYTVDVTDSHGCITQANYTITEPPVLSSTISGTDVNCKSGNDGTATVVPAGGTPGYTYSWAPGGATAPNNLGLSTNTYTVTITDVKGCSALDSIFIDEPVNPLTSSIVSGNVSCNGGDNGFATVTPAGGTAGYTYLWTPGNDPNQTADTLTAGNYFVTITDNNGCQNINSVIITEPPVLAATIINPVNTFCAQVNGQADVSVTGGTPGYTYSWNTVPVQNTPTADSLAAGQYIVIVDDALGCTATDTVTITDTPAGTASAVALNHVSCFGGSDGSAEVNPVGGVAPFMYSWAPSGGNDTIATNLPAGTYTVTITDSENCIAIDSVVITEPTQLTGSASMTNDVSCFGGNNGSAVAIAADGTPGYTYSWSTTPVQTTATATNLTAGTYTVTITDSKGCFITDTATINQASSLVSSIGSFTDVTCNGSTNGTAIANPSGGTPGYTYLWNSSPSQVNDTASNLAPGTYQVIVTDALGCQDTSVVTIGEPAPVITNASANTTICKDAFTPISGTATGGSGTYFYLWDNSLGFGQTQNVSPPYTTDYIVTAYDLNGCPGGPDTVTVSVIRLDQNILFVGGTSPICPGSTSVIYAQVFDSAAGPLTYSWNNGLPPTLGTFSVIPTQPTTYVVTVTNSCGVSITDSVRVDFHPLPVISSAVNTDNGCSPLNVQFTDFSSTPSGPNIAWSWDFGDGGTATGQNPTHTYLPVGSYNVYLTVTSGMGCVSTSASPVNVITVNPSPVANFTADPTTVFLPNGSVQFYNQSTGGTSYEWNFGDATTSSQISPSHVYGAIGVYNVMLVTTNQYTCKDTAYRQIIATSDIVFPTAFTPNSSGPNGGSYSPTDFSNDVFFPYTAGVDQFHLLIFNRWGELIFETFDVKVGWDGYYRGKLCEQDVYVWKAFATFHDGREFNRVGDVTLLR
jgi:PKD repeat protein